VIAGAIFEREVNVLGQSSESFDDHERPTAQRSRPDRADDPNATTRIKPFDLEQLVAKGSGTRPVITNEQIDRYMKERTADEVASLDAPEVPDAPEPRSRDERPTEPAPESSEVSADIRERETVDALTLQRETLVIKAPDHVQTTAQQIPIDVDLSRLLMPTPRPAAGRPVPFPSRLASRLDRRQLTIAGGFVIAMISALLGFIAGRL
jgi:hypothetical protein